MDCGLDLDCGFWIGLDWIWIVDCGLWIVDFGLDWIVGCFGLSLMLDL